MNIDIRIELERGFVMFDRLLDLSLGGEGCRRQGERLAASGSQLQGLGERLDRGLGVSALQVNSAQQLWTFRGIRIESTRRPNSFLRQIIEI